MTGALNFFEPVILIGGGPVRAAQAALVKHYACNVVAADSGLDRAEALGLDIVAVFGDMDSVSSENFEKYKDKIKDISEQNTTDFEKCIYSCDAPLYLCIGFLAGRLDHELAALNVLAKYPNRRIVLIGEQDVTVLCPKDITINVPMGTRVLLFPIHGARGLFSSGLEWALDGLELAGNGDISCSNQTSATPFTIRYKSGALLLILPIENLPELLLAL